MKNYLLKSTNLFFSFLLFANTGWCDGLVLDLNLPAGHQHYSICNSSTHKIKCDFSFSSPMVNDTIYIPIGACILNASQNPDTMFVPIDTTTNSLFYIYKVSASVTPFTFYVDLTAISCTQFFGASSSDAIIAVHHTASGITFSQTVSLNKPSFLFAPLIPSANCIKGRQYTRSYKLTAITQADYDSFIDSALIEPEIFVRDVVIKFASPDTIIGDSVVVHIDTINCGDLPDDPQVTENSDSVLNHTIQKFTLRFAKGTGLPSGTIQLPDSFKSAWSVQIAERFTCISMSSNLVSHYTIFPNPCTGGISACGTPADLPCDNTLADTLNALCTPIATLPADGLSYSMGNSTHGYIDVYNSSSNQLQYVFHNINENDSVLNLKATKRFYGIRFIIDTTYFTIPSVNDIIVKTRDLSGIVYSLSTPPTITMNYDTVNICFKSIPFGTDPDSSGPLRNVFPDPAHPTNNYECDLPGGSSIIVQLNNVTLSATEALLHICNYHYPDFLSCDFDAPTMAQLDLCLQSDRQFHYASPGSCTNFYHRHAASLSGLQVPFGAEFFEGNRSASSNVTDLAVAPVSGTSQTDTVLFTYSFHQTNGISPWDVTQENTTFHAIASHYGETYYAHVSIPPGYQMVHGSGGETYSAVRYGITDTTFYYYTSLPSQFDSVCKNYDLVLPGPSCSISFGVKLISCSPLNETGCLSQNHPTEFNPDSTVSYGTTDFKMEFRSQLNDSTHNHDTVVVSTLKYIVYACEGLTMHLHCFGNCDGYPANISDFSFERNSFGWHSDTSFLAGTGHFTSSQSLVGKHRAYINDAVYSTAFGSIATPIQSCYTNLNFEISYPSLDSINPVFALDSCKLTVHITSGSHQGFYTYSFNSPLITNALDSGNITQTVHFNMTQLQVAAGVFIDSLFHEADSIHNTISFVGFYHVVCASFLPPGHYMIQRVQAQFTLTPATSGCIPLKSCDPWGAAMDVLVIRNRIECNSHVVGGGYGYMQGADVLVLPEGGYPGEVDFPNEYRPLIEYPSDFDFTLSSSFFLSGASLRLPNSVSYQLYDISGRACIDTLNPAFGGHCPGLVIGGPYNPGGVIHFHLDTLIHKFAVNSDTVTALPIPTLTYKLQPKGVPYSFYFDVNRTCLPPSGTADWMAHFNFPFQSFSSYDSLQHYFPFDSVVTCNAATAYAQLDTLYSHVFDSTEFAFLYNADTLEPLAISPGNLYQTPGDTLIFCADYLSFAPGKASYIYSPDPTVQIVSIEEGVNNCNDSSTAFQHLLTNTAGNLFYLTCTQQAGHLRLRIKFNCIQAGSGYSSTPIILNYGEFTNRCSIRTLNPDSASDLALLTSCGIHKRDTIYAQPASYDFSFSASADSSSITFCNNDTIRIGYQLGSGQIYNPQLQIVNTAFDTTHAQFTLKENATVIAGSFNGTADTLTFPLTITDINLHNLSFVYFPGCSHYDSTTQVFHFTMHGTNACGDPIISGTKDTANVHILYQQFTGSNPFSSLTLKGDSIAGCTSTLHDTIRVSYGSFSDSIQFHIISPPFLDSMWTAIATGSGLTIPFLLHLNSTTCTSVYDVTVTATLLSHCSPIHSCPIGSAHTAHKNIHVTCLNCCANADSTYTNGSVSPIPGLSYNINQNINISGNITFSHNNMFIAPNVTIQVPSGSTLTITDSSHLHACNEMWHGIVVNNGGGGVVTIDSGSIVEDADTGLYLRKANPTTLKNCLFTNNYIDVFIDPESGSDVNDIIFNGVTFNGSSSLTKAPHLAQKSYVNVRLNNVMNTPVISIGSASYGLNTFKNSQYGIYATSSTFKVKHDLFKDITPYCNDLNFCTGGMAIYSKGVTSSIRSLTVGGTSNDSCFFINCAIGIQTLTNIESRIQYNRFSVDVGNNLTNSAQAIYLHHHRGCNQYVLNNRFNNCYRGVTIQETYNSNANELDTIRINDNRFNSYSGTQTPTNSDAIRVLNSSIANANPPLVDVIGNYIYKYRHGIYGAWLYNQTTISSNDFFALNSNNPSVTTYGIRILRGVGNKIDNNAFVRAGSAPTLASQDKISGIEVNGGDANIVSNNVCTYAGKGIRFYNSIPSGTNKVQCNILDKNWLGIRIEVNDIGIQGSSSAAQDNYWQTLNNVNASNISFFPGPITPITWYMRSEYLGTGYDPSPSSCTNCVFPSGSILIDTTSVNVNCTVSSCPNPPNCDQERIHDIIKGNEQPMYEEDDKGAYESLKYAFSELKKNPDLMYLGTDLDQDLQTFYDSVLTANIGALNDVANLILYGDTIMAINLNTTLTPENMSEVNAQLVNDIYITTWARDLYDFDEDDYNTLVNIAYQNPVTGGSAVYDARAMLLIDADDYYWDSYRRARPEEKTSDNFGKIVPNPNDGIMQFIYMLHEGEKGTLQLFDLKGHELKFINLQDKTTVQDIDMSGAAQGIYFYRFAVNNEILLSNKIIIAK